MTVNKVEIRLKKIHELYLSIELKVETDPIKFREEVDTILFENIGYMQSWGVHTKEEYIDVVRQMEEQIDAKEETIRQQEEAMDRLKERGDRYVKVFEQAMAEILEFGRLVGIDVESASLEEKARAFNEKVRQQAEEIERLKSDVQYHLGNEMKAIANVNRSEEARKAAERERDDADRAFKAAADTCGTLGVKVAEFVVQNTALRECLAWYEHEETYEIKADDESDPPGQPYTDIMRDRGEKARTLLAELDRKDTQPQPCQTCGGSKWVYTNSRLDKYGDPAFDPCPNCSVEDTQPKEDEGEKQCPGGCGWWMGSGEGWCVNCNWVEDTQTQPCNHPKPEQTGLHDECVFCALGWQVEDTQGEGGQ